MPGTETQSLISGGSSTIFVSDLDRAVRFYTETLGLKLLYQAGEHFAMIDAGGGCLLGLHPPGKHTPPPGAAGGIQVGLNVAQPIEQVAVALEKRGVRFEVRDGRTIIDDSQVKLAFFPDPDGNALYLCEVVAA